MGEAKVTAGDTVIKALRAAGYPLVWEGGMKRYSATLPDAIVTVERYQGTTARLRVLGSASRSAAVDRAVRFLDILRGAGYQARRDVYDVYVDWASGSPAPVPEAPACGAQATPAALAEVGGDVAPLVQALYRAVFSSEPALAAWAAGRRATFAHAGRDYGAEVREGGGRPVIHFFTLQ